MKYKSLSDNKRRAIVDLYNLERGSRSKFKDFTTWYRDNEDRLTILVADMEDDEDVSTEVSADDTTDG